MPAAKRSGEGEAATTAYGLAPSSPSPAVAHGAQALHRCVRGTRPAPQRFRSVLRRAGSSSGTTTTRYPQTRPDPSAGGPLGAPQAQGTRLNLGRDRTYPAKTPAGVLSEAESRKPEAGTNRSWVEFESAADHTSTPRDPRWARALVGVSGPHPWPPRFFLPHPGLAIGPRRDPQQKAPSPQRARGAAGVRGGGRQTAAATGRG
jgi:hypothetical protein